MGIEETKKLIDCLTGNVIGLTSIDYEAIKMELADLDGSEKIELLASVGGAVLEILTLFKGSSILKLLLK